MFKFTYVNISKCLVWHERGNISNQLLWLCLVIRLEALGVSYELETTETENVCKLNVIDTPGLFDHAVDAEFIAKEIISCINTAKSTSRNRLLLCLVLHKTRVLHKEEDLVNAHRKQMEDVMDVVILLRVEMNLLVEADQPGNQLDD